MQDSIKALCAELHLCPEALGRPELLAPVQDPRALGFKRGEGCDLDGDLDWQRLSTVSWQAVQCQVAESAGISLWNAGVDPELLMLSTRDRRALRVKARTGHGMGLANWQSEDEPGTIIIQLRHLHACAVQTQDGGGLVLRRLEDGDGVQLWPLQPLIQALWPELAQDPWLEALVRRLLIPGSVWARALAAGTSARLCTRARSILTLDSLLSSFMSAGVCPPLVRWASTQDPNTLEQLVGTFKATVEPLPAQLRRLRARPRPTEVQWAGALLEILHRREELAAVAGVLAAAGVQDRILTTVDAFDQLGRSLLPEIPLPPEVRRDEWLERAACIEPSAWWTWSTELA